MVISVNFSTKTLEFETIKNKTLPYIYSDWAKTNLKRLIPSSNFSIVENSLNQVNEALDIVNRFGRIPFLANFDNNLILEKVIENKIYTIEELLYLKLYLKMELDIKEFFKQAKKDFQINYLNILIALNDHLKIHSLLNKNISDLGEIYDDATSNLKRIRTSLKTLNSRLLERIEKHAQSLSKHLTDTNIVRRNNRFCLQVKESDKNSVKGIVHDVSKSGQTIFIEPELSIKLSNEIEILRREENKEILNILTNLTLVTNDHIQTLKNNMTNLINLDLIHAKALYAKEIDAIKPKINSEGSIKLIKGRHPLIDQKRVVPISLELSKNNHTLLITGPNTGGKTVSLKTVGLLQLMLQSGFLIPADLNSSFNIFDAILADIGDEQSILNSLSTFSSHMTKIISFIDNLTNNSLILLDELGSGTDPIEGVSLAIAIIEELQKKDIILIVTSHFSELKTYALEKDGFKTASVAFDVNSLKPLYYLEHGVSGESHARLIAKRLGMNEDVISRADLLFKDRESDVQKIISKLSLEREEYLKLQQNALEKSQEFTNKLKQLDNLREKLLKEQDRKVETAIEKEVLKWQEKEKEINELISKLETDYQSHHLATLKNVRDKKVIKEVEPTFTNYRKGMEVYIKSYQQYGKVLSVKDDTILVKFGIFELNFKAKDLTLVSESTKPKKVLKKRSANIDQVTKKGLLTIDLRGFRYEEVNEELDKAIDNALLSNLSSLTIIHGFGTGAIEKAVINYLKKSNLVKSFRKGGEGEGLGGATIVNLK